MFRHEVECRKIASQKSHQGLRAQASSRAARSRASLATCRVVRSLPTPAPVHRKANESLAQASRQASRRSLALDTAVSPRCWQGTGHSRLAAASPAYLRGCKHKKPHLGTNARALLVGSSTSGRARAPSAGNAVFLFRRAQCGQSCGDTRCEMLSIVISPPSMPECLIFPPGKSCSLPSRLDVCCREPDTRGCLPNAQSCLREGTLSALTRSTLHFSLYFCVLKQKML